MAAVEAELLQSVPSSKEQQLQFFQRHQMIVGGEYNLLKAGDPGYLRPFLRDSVIATTLAGDSTHLSETLRFAASIQGTKKDPRTGEEMGAIFHEYDPFLNDGVELSDRRGKTTLYNACDSNALFLLGHEELIRLTGNTSLRDQQKGNIIAATDYILRHLNENNLFVVDPKDSDADNYALRVTYWKDSHLKGRENGEPMYPVVYSLAHIQNMAGLRSASRLLESPEISQKATDMKDALMGLFDDTLDTFSIAIDRGGKISGISSDVLHALNYLEPEDIKPDMLERILVSARVLETPMGYRTLSPKDAEDVEDKYHATTVWTHEQAIIHAGAKKHSLWAEKEGFESLKVELERVENFSSRVSLYMEEHVEQHPELFFITKTGDVVPGGCEQQLWAEAARWHFKKQPPKILKNF